MGSVKQNVTTRIQPCSLPAGQTAYPAEPPAAADKAVCHVATGTGRSHRRTRSTAGRRRGVVTLWLILALPVLLLLLIVLIEIGNIWRARVELENAMEAAALAAVKEWRESTAPDPNSVARQVGVAYAAANSVTGDYVTIQPNYGGAAPNYNAFQTLPNGNLIFGAVTTSGIPWVFDSNTAPSCPGPNTDFAVRAQAKVKVTSVTLGLGGYAVPVFYVSAAATARYSCTTNRPELIRVRPENFL